VSEWVLAGTQSIGHEEDYRATDRGDPKEEHFKASLKLAGAV
jgi:hypothetical protein